LRVGGCGDVEGDVKNESVFKICCIACALVPSLHALIALHLRLSATFPLPVSLPPPPNPLPTRAPPCDKRFVPLRSPPPPPPPSSHSAFRLAPLQPHFRSVLIPVVLSPLRTTALASSSLAGSFQNGIPPPRLSLPSRASVCHSRPTSHAPSRKVSKSLSFFPLRDSYGTTQLVVHTPLGRPSLDGDVQQSNHVADLARIPVESTVLIQGHVRLRPEKQRRPVIAHLIPLGSQTTDSPIGLLSRAPLVMSRFP
jgi:hypothetical protein